MKKLLLFITLITHTLFAELPPYVYEELQKDAPESLLIIVKKVKPQVYLYHLRKQMWKSLPR